MKLTQGNHTFLASGLLISSELNAKINVAIDNSLKRGNILVAYKRQWWALFVPRPDIEVAVVEGRSILVLRSSLSRQIMKTAIVLTTDQYPQIIPRRPFVGSQSLADFRKARHRLLITVPPGTCFDWLTPKKQGQ